MQYLNIGCGTWYADGWVNTDVLSDETTKPDVVVTLGEPQPFDDNTFDAIYLGHVLEHIDWKQVPSFLEDTIRIAKPDAPILIVGPDVLKTIQRWKDDLEPWQMILMTMEHQDLNYQPGREDKIWHGAAHFWNCYHQRVWDILSTMGFCCMEDFFDRIPNDADGRSWTDEATGITWPVVGKWHWQFAIHCRAPQKEQ